jgi:beta-N-acetylhexosaminidase
MLLRKVVEARPDSIVVEMGVPAGEPFGLGHIATHGAATVCGQAAAEYLAGLPRPSTG